MEENVVWRQIILPGEGSTNYEVSNKGDVRRIGKDKILSKYVDRDGYLHSSIIRPNGKQYHPGIHRFVGLAFIPNPENKPEINHKDGNKQNNRVENLEWVTTQENIQHAFDTHLKEAVKGEDNSLSIYSEEQIRRVCELLEKKCRAKDISELVGVDRKYITDIKYGKRWRHIAEQYRLPVYLNDDVFLVWVSELRAAGYDESEIFSILEIDPESRVAKIIIKKTRQLEERTTSFNDYRPSQDMGQ